MREIPGCQPEFGFPDGGGAYSQARKPENLLRAGLDLNPLITSAFNNLDVEAWGGSGSGRGKAASLLVLLSLIASSCIQKVETSLPPQGATSTPGAENIPTPPNIPPIVEPAPTLVEAGVTPTPGMTENYLGIELFFGGGPLADNPEAQNRYNAVIDEGKQLVKKAKAGGFIVDGSTVVIEVMQDSGIQEGDLVGQYRSVLVVPEDPTSIYPSGTVIFASLNQETMGLPILFYPPEGWWQDNLESMREKGNKVGFFSYELEGKQFGGPMFIKEDTKIKKMIGVFGHGTEVNLDLEPNTLISWANLIYQVEKQVNEGKFSENAYFLNGEYILDSLGQRWTALVNRETRIGYYLIDNNGMPEIKQISLQYNQEKQAWEEKIEATITPETVPAPADMPADSRVENVWGNNVVVDQNGGWTMIYENNVWVNTVESQLAKECGWGNYSVKNAPLGINGIALPTGMEDPEYFGRRGEKKAAVNLCLLGVGDLNEENQTVDAIFGAFDIQGNIYPVRFRFGGTTTNGTYIKTSMPSGGLETPVNTTSVRYILRTAIEGGRRMMTVCVVISNPLDDPNYPNFEENMDFINSNSFYAQKLIDALKTGTGFPSDSEGTLFSAQVYGF